MLTSKEVEDAFTKMVMDRIECGFDPHLLSFMFNPIPGSQQAKLREMHHEAERAYAKILTRAFRRPHSVPDLMCLPFWLVCPDWPVPKKQKQKRDDVTINDGMHLHAIALMPPDTRMQESLSDHIRDNHLHYWGADKPVRRLHADPMTKTPAKAVGYAMKSLKRRRMDETDILILPRANDEMSRLSRAERLEDE